MTSGARLAPLLGLVALAAAAAGIVALALATADGVTHLGGSDYETEFVSAWAQLGWLLAAPVYVLARRHRWAAPPAVLAAAVPQFACAHEVVRRYAESGWGDGLESLGYLGAAAMTVAFALAALVGALWHTTAAGVCRATASATRW